MDNYKYKLEYTDDDFKVTHEFAADIDVNELAAHLRDFLTGCSWTEETLAQILDWEY